MILDTKHGASTSHTPHQIPATNRHIIRKCVFIKTLTSEICQMAKKTPISNEQINKHLREKEERVKELSCINAVTALLKEGKTVDETLQHIVHILPRAWQYSENCVARIIYDGKVYTSPKFEETEWVQTQTFRTIENKTGIIDVFYTFDFEILDEGPFLKEERHLIDNISAIISGFLNSKTGEELIKSSPRELNLEDESLNNDNLVDSRKLIQRFLNKQNAARNIYHDLMPFKVKEILLVATLYDAYSIEKEGRFSEHILGEYHQLSLTSLPRVTGVTSPEEAIALLKTKHFDLVIFMMGVDKSVPLESSRDIKKEFPYIPLYMLLNNNSEISYYNDNCKNFSHFDRTFVWNGDSKVFFAMVKHLEDRVNIDNDTQEGMVGVILVVEDSIKYYSRYLPHIYQMILEQTKELIEDVSIDEQYKVLKLRARPKILLATTYEEATEIIDKYIDYIICLISDVKFPKAGKLSENAGFDLIKYVRQRVENLPTLLQSSDVENTKKAYELDSNFINKNSESLLQDLRSFIRHFLGFGSFIYRDTEGEQIAVARSLREFETLLKEIPDESIIYHAVKNHFSMWLMARGEIQIAKIINPLKVSDFKDNNHIRTFLINIIHQFRSEKEKGKVVPFEENALLNETNIVSLASGALGGKGRGLAFINTLIYNLDFSEIITNINIKTPCTSIIGTDDFDIFLAKNKLHDKIHNGLNYKELREKFVESKLSYNLTKRLKIFLKKITKPIAVRSSSLFEDSMMQPFSGIFETYLLPNNHPDINVRLQQLMNAIKLVYASIYSNNARTYFEAVYYKIDEEKMAVIIQEVVGNQFENYFYPHISGTAQSHNYYPVAHMKPEEGFAVAAVGLGTYVVEGERTYRFSPKYPDVDISSPKDLYKSSQVNFLAIDLDKKDINLVEGEDVGLAKLDIYDAEMHGALKHCASVYDPDGEVLYPGIDRNGPRVVNFANILKYKYAPLAKTLSIILDVVKEALGSPVEIEFAVDLDKTKNKLPTFYLLQIKPLVGNEDDYNVNPDKINKDDIILYANKSMGNGKIEDIQDVIFVDEDKFDNQKTLEMSYEIEALNAKMLKENKKYVLIGPGRWGTRDKFIGIPVAWPQISNAKVIVEISLKDFPLDASLGSHFFHNVTSMNVGYFSIQHSSPKDFVNWDVLNNQEVIEETKYFKHVRFKKPFSIVMDGKKRISLILQNNDD